MKLLIILVYILSFVAPVYALDSVVLLGTLLEHNPTKSIAIIKNIGSDKPAFYKVGNTISGYRVARIKRGRVLLLKKGKVTYLDFTHGNEPEPIVAISPNEKIINRSAMAQKIPTLNDASKQLTFIPYIDSGKVKGLKITSLKDKELAAKAGIKEGDIVTSVNNQPLDSLQNGLKIYNDLRNGENVNLQLLSDGKLKDLVYHIN